LRAGFSAWTNKRASSPSEFPLPADRWFFLLNNIEGYEAAAEDKTALLTIIPASYEYILTANSWIAQTVTCVCSIVSDSASSCRRTRGACLTTTVYSSAVSPLATGIRFIISGLI
jgi:hypothetical protein